MNTDYSNERLEEINATLGELYTTMVRMSKISQKLSGKEKRIFDFICGSISNIYILNRDHKEELERCLSRIEEELSIKEEEETPMVLTPFSRLKRKRGIALSQALSSEINAYREELQRNREERYERMIEELSPIESPTMRGL